MICVEYQLPLFLNVGMGIGLRKPQIGSDVWNDSLREQVYPSMERSICADVDESWDYHVH